MNRAELACYFNEEHLRALNRLVFATEDLDAPEMPDVPSWDNSPDSLDCVGDETRTPEEMIAIGREWQELAVKLHDLLEAATAPDAWGDLENVLADVRSKAKEARLAMIALDIYERPMPKANGLGI